MIVISESCAWPRSPRSAQRRVSAFTLPIGVWPYWSLALLESGYIASANRTALEHFGIDTHMGLIVLGRSPKDTYILGEISLGQCCHYAPRAGAADT